jgi:nicotinate-nucleotide adenylyltransferase
VSIALYGGSFDPPHRGHVELARHAKEALGVDKLVVLVSADPGHKRVETSAEVRVEMARAAFPGEEVILDVHARTIDTLRAHPEWEGATFLVGADEFCDFPAWKEPEEVLRRVQLGVATRPGFPRERLQTVLDGLAHPERVRFFEIEPVPVASRELREELVESDLPSGVAEIIRRESLYAR